MNSIEGTGLKGVLAGLSNAAQHAEEAVDAFKPDSTNDPVTPLVGLSQDETQVKASAKIIKVGADLNKAVLDLLA